MQKNNLRLCLIFSKFAGLQPSAGNFTKRWTPLQVFFKDYGKNYSAKISFANVSSLKVAVTDMRYFLQGVSSLGEFSLQEKFELDMTSSF